MRLPKKDHWITMRVDPATKHFVESMAKASGMNQSEFVLSLIYELQVGQL